MRAIVLVAFVLSFRSAHADPGVGVVVTGEPTMQAAVDAQLRGWLREHGYALVASAFPADAHDALVNCFIIEDMTCARGVFDRRATADNLVFARIELQPGARELVLTGYWFVKEHDAIAAKRACPACTDAALHGAVYALLDELARATGRGRLKLRSAPDGLIAILDGVKVGVTPIERDLTPGRHEIQLVEGGETIAQRSVVIEAGATAEIMMRKVVPPPSRVWPGLVIGTGAAAGIAGAILIATSQKETGAHPTYRDTKALGIGVAAGGAVLVGAGIVWWIRRSRADSAPTVAITPGGAVVGWAGAL